MKKNSILLFLLVIVIIRGCLVTNQQAPRPQQVSKNSNPSNTPTEQPDEPPPTPETPTPEVIKECEEITKEWITAAETIALKSKNDNAIFAVGVLKNHALSIPLQGDQALTMDAVTPNDTKGPWVRVIPLSEITTRGTKAWYNTLIHNRFSAQYSPNTNSIMLMHNTKRNAVIKGLVLLHEMCHWKQHNPAPTIPINDMVVIGNEVEAFEFEFSILENLNLPEFSNLISQERNRLGRILKQSSFRIEPLNNNPLLEKVFGKFDTEQSKQEAATIIMIMAVFKEYDSFPEKERLFKKMTFLKSMGTY